MTKPVIGQTTFGASTTGTTTQLDNNFLLAYTALNDFNTFSNYLVDTGAANTYIVTLGANLTGTLAAGLAVQFKATNANTGGSTLGFNGAAAKNILTASGAALPAGTIQINSIVSVMYDGAQFLLLSALPGLRGCMLVFNSAGNVIAAGATGFLSTAFVTAGEQALRVPFKSRVSQMYANAENVPGVGETYVYTFRSAAADTALTCTTSGGASSGSQDTTHTIAVAAGAKISVKAVASGGANAAAHWAAVMMEEMP